MEPFGFAELGAIRQAEDLRDYKLGSIQAPIQVPDAYKPDSLFNLKALYQGHTSGCGGFSLGQLEQYFTFLRTNNPIALSPRFAYMAEKSLDGLPNNSGTTLRAIGMAATKLGICLDSLLTDDIALPDPQYRDFSQASAQAKADALTRKEPSYFFLDDLSVSGLKQAIYQNKAVILEMKVGAEWWTTLNGQISWDPKDILPLRPPASVVSAHYVMVGAYEPDPSGKTRFWLINSFGQSWAQNGFAYFLDDYLPYILGGVVIVDVPTSVQQVLAHPDIPQTSKPALVQQILQDLKIALGLVSQEIGKL
jgi:hypothetical protein